MPRNCLESLGSRSAKKRTVLALAQASKGLKVFGASWNWLLDFTVLEWEPGTVQGVPGRSHPARRGGFGASSVHPHHGTGDVLSPLGFICSLLCPRTLSTALHSAAPGWDEDPASPCGARGGQPEAGAGLRSLSCSGRAGALPACPCQQRC